MMHSSASSRSATLHHVAEVKMEATAMREFSPWRHPPSAARVECRCITIALEEHVASKTAGKKR